MRNETVANRTSIGPEETPVAEGTEDTRAGLQNRRPTGKGSHRMRRGRNAGDLAVED